MAEHLSAYDNTVRVAELNPHTVVDIDVQDPEVCYASIELVNPNGTRDVKILHTSAGTGYFISHHETELEPVAPTYVADYDAKVGEIWRQRALGNDEIADALCAEYGIRDTLQPDK
ncbi:hypothetical protein KA047_03975 [Candidatus Saccharibacteria bacterium]|nr:hypothetical protein [Candidatus Saccharibacteria bacterium]